MPIHLWTVPWRTVAYPEIADRLSISGQRFHWTVATPGQERERNRQDVAAFAQGPVGDCQMLFHRMLRLWLEPTDGEILRRVEERILVRANARRAAEALTAVDAEDVEAVAAHVQQDASLWADALAELAGCGVDLDATRFDDPAGHSAAQDYLRALAHPNLRSIVTSLQRSTTAAAKAEGAARFEGAARDYLAVWQPSVDAIVMEGFTRLTALQQRFLEVASARVAVHVLVPYRDGQDRGFDTVRTAHHKHWRDPAPQVQVEPPPTNALQHLQRTLFGASQPLDSSGDRSVTVTRHEHQDLELAAVLEAVAAYRVDPACRDWRLAIVTADLDRTRALLAEHDAACGGAAGVAPATRLLLLTPLGRFVLALYRAWDSAGGDLRLRPDDFYEILVSGRVRTASRATAPAFAAVKAQWFASYEASDRAGYTDWVTSLDRLGAVVADPSRTSQIRRSALRGVSVTDVACWKEILGDLNDVCARLFTDERLSIADHVQRLLSELRRLDPGYLPDSEREVLTRLEQALDETRAARAIRVSADEFGTALVGLAASSDTGEAGDARTAEESVSHVDNGSTEDGAGAQAPIVTTFEGIDGADFDVVFIVGCNHRDVPGALRDRWPLVSADVDAHLAERRYLFLAATRAAAQQVHLSYAVHAITGISRPSPYLREVQDLLPRAGPLAEAVAPDPPTTSTDSPADGAGGVAAPAQAVVPRPVALIARRESYLLHELAHHAMCPRRYALERMDPRAAQYSSAFHIRFLAEADWFGLTLTALYTDGPFTTGHALRERVWLRFSEQEPSVRRLYPGLRELDWHAIRDGVRANLDYTLDDCTPRVTKWPPGIVAPAQAGWYRAHVDNRVVSVEAPFNAVLLTGSGPFAYGLYTDVQGDEWLRHGRMPPRRPEDEEPGALSPDDVPVNGWLYDAIQQWREWMRVAMQHAYLVEGTAMTQQIRSAHLVCQGGISARVEAIELGRFPKNPGERGEACTYCPARDACTGMPA